MRTEFVSRVVAAACSTMRCPFPMGRGVDNPLRELAHPDGAESVFAVRQLALTDEEFERDCAAVSADLATLAGLV